MNSAKGLFKNLFDEKNITAKRLYTFGTIVQGRLVKANGNGQYSAMIAALTGALAALKKELADADVNLTGQKINTGAVDEVFTSFVKYMSEKEPNIAVALGGRNTPAYKTFYPFKISDYTRATKANMPVLTERVSRAAAKNATALGTPMAAELQNFHESFTTAYNAQQEQIGTVQNDKGGLNTAFVQLQLELTSVVHGVAQLNPGKVAVCSALFPFAALYAQTKHKHYILTGTLEQTAATVLLNHTLTKSVTIALRNTSTNAPLAIWLGATATDAMPGNAITVQPGETKTIKGSDLGNLKNTMLLIKNLSEVNATSYEADFTRLKNPIEGATEQTAAMEVVRA